MATAGKIRNGAVELLRFVFTFLVIAAHYKTKYGTDLLSVGMNGHISVEYLYEPVTYGLRISQSWEDVRHEK